ncbi:MAG TPA: N-formylglutamate amidohydrolase [Polyangiaceae bacterium]|nr:N-formylglutamate amidohydrolase [Polyangiaceae bacterium]
MEFSLVEPENVLTPLVVEVPHAGLFVDAQTLATLAAPASALGRDADLYVDELFQDAPREGAALLVARTSRYVIDLNRSEHDLDPLAVDGGTGRPMPHGLIWRTSTEGRPALTRPISRTELERRLDRYYRPYHERLAALLEARRSVFGCAILLCAHSMPSRGRVGHRDAGRERADIVPGTRGQTTAAPIVIETLDRAAREAGFSIAHDEPYRGGFSTGYYGVPSEGLHAIQIEIARGLYMDELSLAKKPREFERIRSFCRDLVRRLAALRPGSRVASA